ncbi:MAG: N-acetyl-gamma-glutamyl-phosphate reductase [Gemmatimonadales bacterium]|nr:N-acetyl-gamma-glutamyl-phosphate reductase [Gemmatimonadales bacterium]
MVVGAAGYVGGELLRLLDRHPHVTGWTATSRSQAGKRVGDIHPALARSDATFQGLSHAEAARAGDVVFLALEHGESSRIVPELVEAGAPLLIDLAADFRIADPAMHAAFYGAHPAPALAARFTYGLADVEPSRLRGATLIAAPGCFATAAQLALWPLAHAGLRAEPALFAVTGSSGSGAHPKPTTHHPARAHNLFAYSVLSHRHEGEVLQSWRRWTGRADAAARLMTHSGPFVRGIHLTLHARLAEPLAGDAGALVRAAFAGRPFVRVTGQPPELTHVVGTNDALVHAAATPDGRELQLMVVIDNLVKGAGGQAIQAMNLALGLDETAGLTGLGTFPC